jgi:hypothetical protein
MLSWWHATAQSVARVEHSETRGHLGCHGDCHWQAGAAEWTAKAVIRAVLPNAGSVSLLDGRRKRSRGGHGDRREFMTAKAVIGPAVATRTTVVMPRLSRASTPCRRRLGNKGVDGRDEPGHDGA